MMDIRSQYFDWLSDICDFPRHKLVLRKLFETEFVWLVPFDEHRAQDGINLRYRFGRIFGIPDPVICAELDSVPCSILEMMVALAIRSEEQIMRDEEVGDRTSLWIHLMLDNLGLIDYSDERYNDIFVSRIIDTFLNRQYSRTGRGGLFEIPFLEPTKDMRSAEIWSQMCWWCNEQLKGGN